MYENFKFEVLKTSEMGRLGLLHTPHGVVETPNFIFCATKAAIKGLTPQQMRECGTQIILSNTYHLMLQPGGDVLEKNGGLQKFTGWRGPMLTDSGGFQIFSLGHGSVASEIKGKRQHERPKTLLKITEEGAKFRSYIDGSIHMLTPERSMQIQRQLGADLIVMLDECTPFHVDKKYTERSMYLSHRWGDRCITEFKCTDNGNQAMYGVVQGGVYDDLRNVAADYVNNSEFFAHAIGGSLGGTKDQMHDIVSMVMQKLRKDRPVHLLGIGGISDIWHGVTCGIDTFDCVHQTRLARHGGALVKPGDDEQIDNSNTHKEHISIRNARFKDDEMPISTSCQCYTCKNFSRSYIHHLFKAEEMLGMQLLTIHNVQFMNDMMRSIRNAIQSGTLLDAKKLWVSSQY